MSSFALPSRSNISTKRLERAWTSVGGVSIRTKIMGIVLILTIVLGLGVTWQVRTVMNNVFMAELDNRGKSVTSDLATRSIDIVLFNDNFALYRLLKETVSNHPDARYAFVEDADGQIVAHTFGDEGFPTALLAINENHGGVRSDSIKTIIFMSNEGVIHNFVAPVFDGKLGMIHLGLAESRLTNIINTVTGRMLLTTLVVAITGILAAILLTWLLTRPILHLVEATQEVGRGNLQTRARHWADDEIGDLADAFNQMVRDLGASQSEIAEKDAARGRLLEQLITAQEEERKRISRELHDGIGQALTSLIVGMKITYKLENANDMQEKSEELCHFAADTLDQVRIISRQLRPSVLDDLGLSAALERFADEFTQLYPGVKVDLHATVNRRLQPAHEISLYRIIQEAMTNAGRHSNCRTISVLIQQRKHSVQAIVEDDGRGFDPVSARREGRSVGIHGMAERAELVGGSLGIESSSEGTTVYVETPL